ncbi:hypothetical protein GO496_10650 [Acidovorax citrulli]|nr:hypothetical protein [Paracidovorax citrulli]
MMNIIPVWYWTDANDWCTAADPADIPRHRAGLPGWPRRARAVRAGLAHRGLHVRGRQAHLQDPPHLRRRGD